MKILLGDIRPEIAKDLQRRIVKLIDERKNKESYYILIWAGIDIETGIIRSRLILTDKMPPKMLGTLLFFVDNKAGKVKRVWALPLDIPILEPSEEMVEEVFRSSHDMPILRS
jgi:hypothetical protein